MRNLDIEHIIIDFTPALPYLRALEIAEDFPALFAWCQRHEPSYYDSLESHIPHNMATNQMLEEAMNEVDKYCPWLWPAIDKAILELVSNE